MCFRLFRVIGYTNILLLYMAKYYPTEWNYLNLVILHLMDISLIPDISYVNNAENLYVHVFSFSLYKYLRVDWLLGHMEIV
jgi:hypothetical protein